MGYGVYITRKNDWADEGEPEITREEWVRYIAVDKSLELDRDHAAAVDPRVASGTKEATHARWKDWSQREPGAREAWMWLERGNIVASDADAQFRRKLFLIADSLNARLMGDDGEVYNSIGEPDRTSGGKRRPWWKFW